MKKYNDFLVEKDINNKNIVDAKIVKDDINDIDTKYKQFYNTMRQFIYNNFKFQKTIK